MNSVTTASVEKAYRRYARYYDLVFGAIFHPGRKTAIEHLHCKAGDRILEVGVGTGLSLSLYPNYVKLKGIDLSEPMLKQARERAAGLEHVEELLEMDAQDMKFEDNSFDSVVAMYVASVVPDVTKLYEEIRRVCKPGGKIIFLNHFENKNHIIRKAESVIQPLAEYLGFHPDFPMEEFLSKTGFQITTAVPVNLLDYWTVLIGYNDKPSA
ncbi:MAG: class I SAM-dependent methyltransferase [Proteobacteria bacterium]|nr:MAG: class I SAM-dependent methyltransferase [Pseudomonadota bacterium]